MEHGDGQNHNGAGTLSNLDADLNLKDEGGTFRDALMQLCDMLEPSHVYYFTDEQGSVEQGSQASSSTSSSGPSMDYSMQI